MSADEPAFEDQTEVDPSQPPKLSDAEIKRSLETIKQHGWVKVQTIQEYVDGTRKHFDEEGVLVPNLSGTEQLMGALGYFTGSRMYYEPIQMVAPYGKDYSDVRLFMIGPENKEKVLRDVDAILNNPIELKKFIGKVGEWRDAMAGWSACISEGKDTTVCDQPLVNRAQTEAKSFSR